jgi:hypothetical protein
MFLLERAAVAEGLTKSLCHALFRRHSSLGGAGRTVMGLVAAQQLPRAPQSQGL